MLLIVLFVLPGFAQESPHGQLSIPCNACHSTDSWTMRKDATFDHASTGFALVGKHATVKCASCHNGLVYTRISADCNSCHGDVHKKELGSNCLRCHSM